MSDSAHRDGTLSKTSKIEDDIDLPGQLELLPNLPSDILVAILGWLSMPDMLAITRVSSAWRQLALQTPTLWWDLAVLNDISPEQDVTRFVTLLQRSGSASICVSIGGFWSHYVAQSLLDRLRAALGANLHRIRALRFPKVLLYPCGEKCSFFGGASLLLRGLGAQPSSQRLDNQLTGDWEMIDIPSFNLDSIRRLIVNCYEHTCPISCFEVHDLECGSDIAHPLIHLVRQYPNTRVLSVYASVLRHDIGLLGRLKNLIELSIMYNMTWDDMWDFLGPFMMESTIRRIMVDVTSYDRRFLQSVRHSLKALPSSDSWHVTFRSGVSLWPQDSMFFVSDIETHLTVELKLGDGRERAFVFHKFGDALERIARPLLHDPRTTSVTINGVAALQMLYSGVGDANLSQVQTLNVVASDDESLVIPRRRVGLPNLKLVIFARCNGMVSRLTTGRVEAWLVGIRLDTRPDLNLDAVFVYEEGGPIMSATLSGGRMYQRSWRQASIV